MKNLTFLLLFTFSFTLTCCQTRQNNNLKTTEELIRVLSSDSFEGRYPGDSSFTRAAIFTEEYLGSIGVKPYFENSYRDTMSLFSYKSFNVVGVIENENSSGEYILIGAHLDHLGKIESPSDSVFNGANDNATGVTAVLQIAAELMKYKFDKKIIIALFTGEEMGLRGSKHLARRLKNEGVNLSYMINIEMIGKPLT